jgi:thiol-disulfide isomerase/thioredoxin
MRILPAAVLVLTGAIAARAAPAAATPPLDGAWLVAAAEQGGEGTARSGWDSVLTIHGNAFTLSHFRGTQMTLSGTFEGAKAGGSGAFELHLDPVDLSATWTGLKYPACTVHGIYDATGPQLKLAVRLNPELERPADFSATSIDTLAVAFERANAGFQALPQKVTVRVQDERGAPVAGAKVFSYMHRPVDMQTKEPQPWVYLDVATTDADGRAEVATEKLASDGLWARTEEGGRAGFAVVSPASLQNGAATVALKPAVHIHGTLTSAALTAAGKEIGWTNVYLETRGQRLAMCQSLKGDFEFIAPAGTYRLRPYGSSVWRTNTELVVPEGKAAYEAPPIAMTAMQSVLLEGRPAPELEGVAAWRGKPVRFADLKGKVVLLDFWGYWCGPCVQAMPILMDLQEKYKDDLAVVSVHVDDHVSTVAELEERIDLLKREVWKGRDLPFPVAITPGRVTVPGIEQPVRGKAAAQYGVQGYPTTILIDREGKVAGDFPAQDRAQAFAEMEKLLKK